MASIILIVALYLFIQMIVVWLAAIVMKNPSIIDVFWPIGLVVSGLIYLFSFHLNQRSTIIAALLIIWGVRLSSYLFFTRAVKNLVDKRYVTLSQEWKISKSLGYFLHFQLQGLLILVISIVFLFASMQERINPDWLDMIGIITCVVGIVGETFSDKQLHDFKIHNKGKVCNKGLWRYSRHPNYFFDWLTWCGFACFGFKAELGYISLISPFLLYLIMTKMTGPITERASIASRGDLYLEYQRSTSMFFPWSKR